MRISDWSSDVCSSDLHAELSVVCLDGHAVFLLPQSVASLNLSQFSSLFVLLTVRRALCLMRSAHPHTVRKARHPLALPVANASSGRIGRPEERRVGKESVSTCRSRWSPDNSKK